MFAVEFCDKLFAVFDNGVQFFRWNCDSVVRALVPNLGRVFELPMRMGLRCGKWDRRCDIVVILGTSGSQREIGCFSGLGL